MITSCKNTIFEKKTRKMKKFFWEEMMQQRKINHLETVQIKSPDSRQDFLLNVSVVCLMCSFNSLKNVCVCDAKVTQKLI